MDAFAHVSHTFTHEDENNATYFDVFNEISWNQAWLTQVGIAAASKFSASGIIPPAITGLHNGDALQAWATCGITNVVGDNTRPVLLNTVSHVSFLEILNDLTDLEKVERALAAYYYRCR